MREKTIRVLVVDDSSTLREMLSDILKRDRELEVVGTARDGQEALQQIGELRPDVVTLDLQMPRLDGLQTLERLLETRPTPAIMVSSQTRRDADITWKCLERGALDYIAKPEGGLAGHKQFGDELIRKVKTMAGVDVRRILRIRKNRGTAGERLSHRLAASAPPVPEGFAESCVALGISTGGPPALSQLFQELRPPLPPMVVVQHMPAQFTGPFARRLDSLSPLAIKEAETGDTLRPGGVYLAPGGRHLRLRQRAGRVELEVFDGEPVSGHRPSVDVMMESAVKIFSDRLLGVIMTGMGHDGAAGCGQIRGAGGFVLGQDEATSDVYGMNKVAFREGHVDQQFALDELPALLTRQCRQRFSLCHA